LGKFLVSSLRLGEVLFRLTSMRKSYRFSILESSVVSLDFILKNYKFSLYILAKRCFT